MANATVTPRIMNSRAILARELRDLPVGATLFVPFKYCSVSNIKATVSNLRREGLDFDYDNTGTEYSVITRTI